MHFSYSASSPVLGIVRLYTFASIVPHCGFWLHFPYYKLSWISLYIFSCLYFLFCKTLIHVLYAFPLLGALSSINFTESFIYFRYYLSLSYMNNVVVRCLSEFWLSDLGLYFVGNTSLLQRKQIYSHHAGVIKHMVQGLLAVQWLRIRLPMEGMQIQSLIRELRSHMPRGN